VTRTSYATWPCPIARSIDVIGDAWTLLILRESFFFGARRFGDFEDGLGVPTNVLTSRLRKLVSDGILTRHQVSTGRAVWEYRPTSKGSELWPVLAVLLAWGNRWVTDVELAELPLLHRSCGASVYNESCSRCGVRLGLEEVEISRAAFLDVSADQIGRWAKDDFRTDRDVNRAESTLRKLARAGCLDRDELVAALRRRGLSAPALDRMDAMLAAG
jgi:DNA-binding HxlR family transcriptional regulator